MSNCVAAAAALLWWCGFFFFFFFFFLFLLLPDDLEGGVGEGVGSKDVPVPVAGSEVAVAAAAR